MAKEIQIVKQDGSVDVYKSSLLRGVHVRQTGNGVCVTEKKFFRPEKTVQCYSNRAVSGVSTTRCIFCEQVNPTQRPNR